MADMPEVGLNAVLDNLSKFEQGSKQIIEAYNNIMDAADNVEDTTEAAVDVISGLGGVASTVASGGLTLLAGAVAAVAAATVGAVAGLGLMAKASFDLSSEIESSQKNIQAQLGLTEEEAEKLGEIATQVWANNFGGSVEEATAALIEVRKQLKGISDEELQDATENAFRLSDAFGVDITESTNAANVLMRQFGISQQEAFDFITAGFQRGLNSSDDFLDSISEYGGLFGQAGGDSGQFFSLLETGLQGGVLGTDKAADAFKEFQIRFLEGGEDVEEALRTLGIDPWEDMVGAISSGRITTIDAFETMIQEIGGLEDPIERNRLGVALFGTQFEDLGADAALAIDVAKTSLDELSGSTDTLNAQYETLPSLFEGVKRRVLLAIAPIGDSILEAANDILPLLFDAIEDMKPALEDFAELLGEGIASAAQELIPWIRDTLVPALVEFGEWLVSTGIPALKDFAQFVGKEVIPVIIQFADWIGEELIPFIEDLFKLFKQSKKQGKTVTKAFDDILDSIEPLVEKVLPELLEIWNIIKKWTDKNWPLIQKTIKDVMEDIQKIIENVTKDVQKFWEKWGDEIMDVAEFVFETVFKIVKVNLENVLGTMTAIMKVFQGDWRGAWNEVEKIIRRSTDALVSIADKAFDLLFDIVSDIMSDIVSDVARAWNDLKRDTETALNNLRNSISSIWNSIKANVENIVTNMINSIINKINVSASSIQSALINMFNNALSAVANVVGSLGSLIAIVNNMINAMRSRIIGLWATIRDGISTAINTALNLFNISSILGAIQNIASSIMVSLKGRLITLWTMVRDGISVAITTAVALITLPFTALKNVGDKIIQGVIDGINAAKARLRAILEGVADLIPQWLAEWLGIASGAKLLRPIGSNTVLGIQEGIAQQVPSLLKQLQSQVAAPLVAAPAMGAVTTSTTTNVFNMGGNNISNGMDAALFDQMVLNTIRNNL